MKQDKLFSKFDALKVAATDNLNLAAEDQAFCLKVQEDFDLIMENLADYQNLFSALEKQDRFPKSLNILWPALAFLPAPVSSDISLKRQEAIKAFTGHVLDYFSKRFHLKETDKLNFPQKPTLTYKDILSKLFAHFGSLDRAGEEFLKKEFKTKISSWRHDDRLEGLKIAFSHVFYYETRFGFGYCMEPSKWEKMEVVIKAISFFETGQLTNIIESIAKELPRRSYSDKIDCEAVYEFSGLKKVKGVRFFKNGRLDILFYSPELAREFFKLFDCVDKKTVKEDRR